MKILHISLAVGAYLCMAAHAWCAPLSLQDCLHKARDVNPLLKSAAWESHIAVENSRLASSTLYPRVDTYAGYTVQREPQAVKLGGVTAETQDQNFAFAGVAATYTLYDFGIRDAKIRQAKFLAEAASEEFKAESGDVTLRVMETYFRILEAERLIQAADEEIIQMTEHRRIAHVLFEEGAVTRNDVLQADVRLASTRQKKLALTNVRENSWLLLNFHTGSDPGFRAELDGATTLPAMAETSTGTADRHDIAALKQKLLARESGVRGSRENYLPEIYTRIGMDYVQNDKVREQAIFSATAGVKVNLFDGYAASAAREKAIKQRSQQQDILRLSEQRARLEITSAGNDAQTAQERISVTEAAIRQSEENLRINRERYQERVGIASEVLDAQTLVTQSKSDYYRALYDYQTATARLQNARGQL